MRNLLLLLFLVVAAFGQATLTVFDLPDITLSASPQPLYSSGVARWCQLTALSGNGAIARWGGSTVSTSRGGAIAPGAGQFIPPTTGPSPQSGTSPFSLASVYVVGTSPDKLTITCAR